MEDTMILICGIHGVGKTYYCKNIEKKLGIPVFSASQLIIQKELQKFDNKTVSNINKNQDILIKEVLNLQKKINNFILDGHLCLLNKSGHIERLPIEVIKALNITEIIVLVDSPQNIKERLLQRDNIHWDYNFINRFQNREIEYAKKISKEFQIDLQIITNNTDNNSSKERFGKNIILPIKPNFAEEILCNRKKYEFRKKLCTDNIDKIYLYATSPIKGIIGEVAVLSKLTLSKDRLWNLSQTMSGISSEYYDEYFKNSLQGNAYFLGEAIPYNQKIKLQDINIFFAPQSYIYTDEILNT